MNNNAELEYYLNRIVLLSQKATELKMQSDFKERKYKQNEYKKIISQIYRTKYNVQKLFYICQQSLDSKI